MSKSLAIEIIHLSCDQNKHLLAPPNNNRRNGPQTHQSIYSIERQFNCREMSDINDDFDLDYESDEDINQEMAEKSDNMDCLIDAVDEEEPAFEANVDEYFNEDIVNDSEDSDKYKILGVDQIVDLMNDSLSEVMEVIDIPNNLIRILLNHFNWDKNKLLEQYFDGNKEKLLTDAHILDPNVVMKSAKKTRRIEMCLICYDEVNQKDMTSISCGHEFCIRKYFKF